MRTGEHLNMLGGGNNTYMLASVAAWSQWRRHARPGTELWWRCRAVTNVEYNDGQVTSRNDMAELDGDALKAGCDVGPVSPDLKKRGG